jgi:hypothetical protein
MKKQTAILALACCGVMTNVTCNNNRADSTSDTTQVAPAGTTPGLVNARLQP